MRTCRQCRFAQRGYKKDERRCMLHENAPRRVNADSCECAGYEVSAGAYLDSVVDAEERIKGKIEKAKAYREWAHHATGSREAMRTSGGRRSKVADNMDRCMDIARDLDTEAALLRERYAKARKMIEDLQSAEQRRVVHMRHLQRMRWEEIARRMRYDVRQVQRIDGKGLALIQRQMNAISIRR